jgi:phosphopentomutase
MNNFIFIVLDGLGVGQLPDASNYNDAGSDTLGNLSKVLGGLSLPNLQKMGLGNISEINGVPKVEVPLASFGKMNEISKGKDSTTGHWELAGVHVDFNFSYFPDGFPKELMEKFLHETGCSGFLGNKPASGTEIIAELGDEHLTTGFPIVYTSADSVFQIAAHEQVIPLEQLYKICELTRNNVLVHPYRVGRVIARPFIGTSNNFKRTTNRHDYSLDAPEKTLLDVLFENGIDTVAIGKINDLFNHRGIKFSEYTNSNKEGCNKIVNIASKTKDSFIMINLVDFDVYYGHRNDSAGLYKALKEFDDFLPKILNAMDSSDYLIITSDHGNDTTDISTDHTREYVPLLFYNKLRDGKNLGIRNSFSDAGKTAADFFKVNNSLKGVSFLNE